MISVKDLKRNQKKPNLRDGKYIATVTYCDFPDNYADKSAIKVCYELESATGTRYEYSEVFNNNIDNPRTYSFFCHLEDIGISLDNIQEFVGVRESITLKRTFVGSSGKSVLTIDPDSRQVIKEVQVDAV